MKRIIFIFSIISAAAIALTAAHPVKWRMTARLGADGAGVLTVKASIAPGWHLYSTTPVGGGPRPTVIDLSQSQGIKITGQLTPSAKPIEKLDANFGVKLGYWEGSVTFTAPFTLTAPREKASAKATVSYMACDDNTCAPPKKIEITSAVLPPKNNTDR